MIKIRLIDHRDPPWRRVFGLCLEPGQDVHKLMRFQTGRAHGLHEPELLELEELN